MTKSSSRILFAVTLIAGLAVVPVGVSPGIDGCLQRAAVRFDIPVLLLKAIQQQEAGRPGTAHRNANDTIDYGVMQINSIWLAALARRGYSRRAIQWGPCPNILSGAWILSRQFKRRQVWRQAATPAVFWAAVGDYHSRTPSLNRRYAQRIWQRYRRLDAARRPATGVAPLSSLHVPPLTADSSSN